MSIKSELTKTASYLRNARNAIIGRGGEISLTAGLKDLSDAIYAIPSDAALVYQTEESVAYRKSVPTDVLNFAKVSKVGGMSYKTENLIPFPYSEATKTVNGITFTPIEGGGLKVEGTSTNYASFTLALPEGVQLQHGKAYSISPKTDACTATLTYYDASGVQKYWGAGGVPFTWDSTYTLKSIYIQVLPSKTANETIYPMLNEGSAALPYKPYFAGLRRTKVSEIVSEGANLIPFPYELSSLTQDGVTFTAMEDGTIVVDGTNTGTANVTVYLRGRDTNQVKVPKGTYTISGIPSGYSSGVRLRALIYENGVATSSIEASSGIPMTKTFNDGASLVFVLYIKPNETVSNLVVKPMLNRGATAVPYKPYRADNPIGTLAIPEAVQALDGYGESNPDNTDEYNYLDFDRMEFFAVGHIVDGVWVRYETPIVTDVTEFFTATPFIEVEGGGTLTAVNEYEQAAPSTINYITETAGI